MAALEVYLETGKFQRIFISIAACIEGFKKGCRPLVELDGTHIKSKWRGAMLAAVGKDANGGFLTLAFAGT